MRPISAVIISFNEAAKIEQALSSLETVADEIVVVDSGSTDATSEICRRYTNRLIPHAWQGYCRQKQFATDQAQHDWVLSVDADEVLSPELRQELIDWKNRLQAIEFDGYCLPRKTFFMGRWIEHTTWYPDWQLRLFRRSRGRWQGGRVHESFRVSGPAGRLQGHLFHYTYSTFAEYLEQLDRFSTLAAADAFDRGARTHFVRLLFHPLIVFLQNYLWRLGWLDGLPGLVVSGLSAVSCFFKYLKLWELQHTPIEAAKDRSE